MRLIHSPDLHCAPVQLQCFSLSAYVCTQFLGLSQGALIEWSESELNNVKRLCVQAYKNAWHLPQSTASALFIFPKTHAGKKSTLPMAVLTQELLLHAERCMRHEDVSKKIMLAGLNRTLDEWLCDSFVELIEEMELWKWDDVTGHFWSRLAKTLQLINISVTWAE